MGSKGYGKIGATLAIGPTARKTRARSSFSDVATCLPTPLATMGSYSTKLHDCLKMNKSTRSHTFVKLAKPLILPIHLGPIRPSPLNAWEWFPYITKFRKLCGESATMGHLQKSWPAVIFGRLGQCKTWGDATNTTLGISSHPIHQSYWKTLVTEPTQQQPGQDLALDLHWEHLTGDSAADLTGDLDLEKLWGYPNLSVKNEMGKKALFNHL